MVSLAQVALSGIAGFAFGNLVDEREHEGPEPRLEPLVGVVCAASRSRRASALVFGAIASRSIGIYFLMITLVYSVIV